MADPLNDAFLGEPEEPVFDDPDVDLQTELHNIRLDNQCLRDDIASIKELLISGVQPSRPPTPPASPPEPRSVRPSVVDVSSPSSQESLYVLPDKFDGDRATLSAFLHQLDLLFKNAARRFPDDSAKVALVGQLLRGPASQWLANLMDNQPEFAAVRDNYRKFRALLQHTFGDATQSTTAAVRLVQLRQGRSTVANFTTDFRSAAALLPEWPDVVLMTLYNIGLAPEIGDMLLQFPPPASLLELMTLAQRAEHRLLDHRRVHHRFVPRVPRVPPLTLVTPATLDVEPKSPRRALTDADREMRRQNNLCLYCGAGDHFLQECPVRPQARRSTSNASKNGHRQ